MKKSVFIIIITLVFLCSCNKIIEKDTSLGEKYKNASGFDARISITAQNTQYSFLFERRGKEYCKAEFLTPESLKGLVIETNGSEKIIKYKNINIPSKIIPSEIGMGLDTVSQMLMSLENAAETLPVKTKNETCITLAGELYGVNSELTFDVSTLMPLNAELTLNSQKISVSITDFNFKEEKDV